MSDLAVSDDKKSLSAGKTMTTLTHHKKSVRALALHPTEYVPLTRFSQLNVPLQVNLF